ncbi:hypothetical protein DIPPA_13910 [Diplonema papillatum]|nr:hypothetical protein DIPPA_13910 [Diplonema papillatum]
MTEGLMPGQGTNNTLVLMDTMKRSKLNPTAAFLAYCLRVFSTKEGVHHFVQVCRQAVTLSSGVLLEGSEENVAASVTKSFVLDSPWLFHCLERPLRELDFSVCRFKG